MFSPKIAALAVSTTVLAGTASAATIVNGSFEQPGTFTGSFQELAAGSTGLTGWTIGAGGVDLINTLWQHDDGNYSLDLSRRSAGTISQTISDLVQFQTYKVTFAMAGNSFSGNSIKSLTATMGMAGGGVFNFDVTGQSNGNMGWVDKSFTFTAGATSGVLSFASGDNNAYGPALDNVRISAVSAVPIPASGLLLVGAYGALSAARRRRKS